MKFTKYNLNFKIRCNFYFSQGKRTIIIASCGPNKSVFYGVNGILQNPYIVAGTFEIAFSSPVDYNITNMLVRPEYEFAEY